MMSQLEMLGANNAVLLGPIPTPLPPVEPIVHLSAVITDGEKLLPVRLMKYP